MVVLVPIAFRVPAALVFFPPPMLHGTCRRRKIWVVLIPSAVAFGPVWATWQQRIRQACLWVGSENVSMRFALCRSMTRFVSLGFCWYLPGGAGFGNRVRLAAMGW
jgi:hypothetical protein